MSDYVRKKAVRYKLKENELERFLKLAEEKDMWLIECIEEFYNMEDSFQRTEGFAIDDGYDGSVHQVYVDFVLGYQYGDMSGDFEFVTELKPSDLEKVLPIFQKKFPELQIDEVRYVDYCYYNGVDAPTVYDTLNSQEIDISPILREE